MAMDGLLSLRWNNHSSSFLKQLSFLRDKETYSDMTLVCGGQFYQVHRLVVSGCSEYFRAILEHTPCRHPAVVLQDLPPRHLEALLSYMYLGQVSVPQDQLGGLIRAAECLAIKGLAVPDEATPSPTPPPPPHQESRSRPSPAWEDGPPHPKRRRQDGGEASSSPGPPAHKDDSGRSSKGSSRGSSPHLSTPSTTPHQNTLSEDTPPPVRVKEDIGNPVEVKCEGESMFDLSDPCESLMRHQEASHREDGEAAYNPATGGNNSVLQQYPSQPQSFEEVVSEALPGTSGMPEETGQGWEGDQSKGDMTTAGAPAFLMDNFPPQQDPITPTHHTALHQRGPGISGWVNQGSDTQPLYPAHTGSSHSTQPWPAAPQTIAGEGGGVAPAAGMVPDRRCCQICGYMGQDVSQLRKHLRIHTGEKPFQCPACSYSSTQSSNLKVHIKRHHPLLCQGDATAATTATDGRQPQAPVLMQKQCCKTR